MASASTQQLQQQEQFAIVAPQPSAADIRATTTSTSSTTAVTNVSTPSSLSGFLAPGGQLPVHKEGGIVVTGKPSIVKVTLSPPSQQQQQQVQQQQQIQQHQKSVEEQAQASMHLKYPKSTNNHQQAYQLPPTRSTDTFQSTPFKTSSASDWYYTNYNKTNVEPFVSKTSVSQANRFIACPTAAIVLLVAMIAVPEFR